MYEEEYKVETVEDKQTALPLVEGGYVEETGPQDWYSYLRISLSELEDNDEYTGKPLLLPVEKVQYDEEDTPKYRARLLLIDDENEEYLQINLNLKKEGSVQTNIHSASSLYALIAGIENLHNPQWSRMYNRIKSVNLSDWETYLASKESMTVKVHEKQGNNFTYNSFRIVDLK